MTEFAPYRTEAEIEEVVRRFEACEYKPEEFFHARHVTVTSWYFLKFGEETARERMCSGLMTFIRHHGRQGYHETITQFWLRMVENEVREASGVGCESVALVNLAVARLGDKNLIYEYYSRERLQSAEAKTTYLEPDLKALPGGRGQKAARGKEISSSPARR